MNYSLIIATEKGEAWIKVPTTLMTMNDQIIS